MRQPKVEKAFENMVNAAMWAGVDTTNLAFSTGSKTYRIAYRLYTIDPQGQGHSDWPYAPPGGFLGMTAGEAINTLDTMRYVFYGIANVKAQQEYDARKEA